LVGLAAVVSVLIDIQFNAVVDESFATTDTKTAFFGRFFAVLNLFAFLFQLLVVPRVLRVAGVGTALFVLPVALALGSATLLIAPVLLSGALAKALDAGAAAHCRIVTALSAPEQRRVGRNLTLAGRGMARTHRLCR
jgi:ATP/ADP translocase